MYLRLGVHGIHVKQLYYGMRPYLHDLSAISFSNLTLDMYESRSRKDIPEMIRLKKLIRSATYLALWLILGMGVRTLNAADLTELEGTWIGSGENISIADDKSLSRHPAVMDVLPTGTDGALEVYVTVNHICQKVQNVSYADNILRFEYGLYGFLPILPIEARITDASRIEFEYKVIDPAVTSYIKIDCRKRPPVVLTDEEISGTYRGQLIDPSRPPESGNDPIRHNVVLELEVKGTEAFKAKATIVCLDAMSNLEKHKRQEVEFKRFVRVGSRLFLLARSNEQEDEYHEKQKSKTPTWDANLARSVFMDTFHIWMEEDGRARAAFGFYIGNGEGFLIKDPPKEEEANEKKPKPAAVGGEKPEPAKDAKKNP